MLEQNKIEFKMCGDIKIDKTIIIQVYEAITNNEMETLFQLSDDRGSCWVLRYSHHIHTTTYTLSGCI